MGSRPAERAELGRRGPFYPIRCSNGTMRRCLKLESHSGKRGLPRSNYFMSLALVSPEPERGVRL